jgi:hypothetical protein
MSPTNGYEMAARRLKAERLAFHIAAAHVTAAQVRELIRMEDENFDTTDFWQNVAAKAGVNFPSRKGRELVASILNEMEASHV